MATNCYILTNAETRTAAVIDPGATDDKIWAALDGYRLTDILLTHAHFDHIGGVGFLASQTEAQIWVHQLEAAWLKDPQLNLSVLVGPLGHVTTPAATIVISQNETYTLLDHELSVRHTPGHTPGHVIYYIDGNAFVGDAIFLGSIGRTDFPGGDHKTLIQSIKKEILTLPKDTPLHPGHGPATTVHTEQVHNPFLQKSDTL